MTFLELEETDRKRMQQNGCVGHATMGYLDRGSPLKFSLLFPWKVWLQLLTLGVEACELGAEGRPPRPRGTLGILAGRLG